MHDKNGKCVSPPVGQQEKSDIVYGNPLSIRIPVGCACLVTDPDTCVTHRKRKS